MIHPIGRDLPEQDVRRSRPILLDSCVPSDDGLELLDRGIFAKLKRPVDLLASSDESRGLTEMRRRHTWSGSLPRGSAVYAQGAYVATPEFVFLQLARRYPLPLLALLGYELCGSYSMPVGAHPGTDGDPCLPATNIASLRKFLDKSELDLVHGIRRARQAASYVAETSDSPRESAMVILLCFPKRQGGYGLPLPSMNALVSVPAELHNATGRRNVVLDAYWPTQRCGAEYDGRIGHSGDANMLRDYDRASVINAMGIKVSTISGEQIRDARAFDLFSQHLAHDLSFHLRRPENPRTWASKNRALRHAVLLAHSWE
jgi:hypothetical protein